MNSLLFVLNKLQKDKIKLKKNFLCIYRFFSWSSANFRKGIYKGSINKLGSVYSKIN